MQFHVRTQESSDGSLVRALRGRWCPGLPLSGHGWPLIQAGSCLLPVVALLVSLFVDPFVSFLPLPLIVQVLLVLFLEAHPEDLFAGVRSSYPNHRQRPCKLIKKPGTRSVFVTCSCQHLLRRPIRAAPARWMYQQNNLIQGRRMGPATNFQEVQADFQARCLRPRVLKVSKNARWPHGTSDANISLFAGFSLLVDQPSRPPLLGFELTRCDHS